MRRIRTMAAIAMTAALPAAADAGDGAGRWTRTYGSFFGGGHFERIQSIQLGPDGSIYLAGHTGSADFPTTPGVFQTAKQGEAGGLMARRGLDDGYVAKLSPDGRRLIWATLIGGSKRDQVYTVRVDSSNNVYAVGATGSADFPTTPGAFDREGGGDVNSLADAFLAKFDPDGRLIFSTYLGGAAPNVKDEENPRGAVLLDEARGLIYIAGLTTSSDFPTTPDAVQPSYGGGRSDGFVAALSLDGARLVASTFLGGNGADMAFTGLAQHPDGSIYVAGATNSPDFPVTPGAYDTSPAFGDDDPDWQTNADAFVARLSPDLKELKFATFLGGSAVDAVSHNEGLTVDGEGRPVVIGSTRSEDFPTTEGALGRRIAGEGDGFVAVLSAGGDRLIAATLFGGTGQDDSNGVAVDDRGRIHFGGSTDSRDLPTTDDALQPDFAAGAWFPPQGTDGFYAVMTPDLGQLLYATYLGGAGPAPAAWAGDRVRSVRAAPDGSVWVAGVTNSDDTPVTGDALQPARGGEDDGFLFRFEEDADP